MGIYANRYYIYAEDRDGLDDYSEWIAVDTNLGRFEMRDAIRDAAKEYYRQYNTSPSGDPDGINWHDVHNLPEDLCEKHGFAIESLAFDDTVFADEYIYSYEDED